MCGIAGIVSKQQHDLHLPSLLHKMSKRMAHRGPDDEGFYVASEYKDECLGGDDTATESWEFMTRYKPEYRVEAYDSECFLGLVHRRLSILDLSPSGHQPFCSVDGNYWITFNGEIYNYKALRKELESFGFRFVTNTDTEVLLNAYIAWGTEMFEKLNGMWAFVIYDKLKQKIIGSRDRFGVKPFYFINNSQFFAFASEIKAFMDLSFYKAKMNETAVFDFLVNDNYEQQQQGFFKDVFELQPSHVFEYNVKTHETKSWQYYHLNHNTSTNFDESKFKNIVEETEEKLVKSIELRLQADVEVGTCLSGGVDSSTIAHYTHQLTPNSRRHAFTASFEDKRFDESHFAQQIAKQANLEWHQIFPSEQELMKDLEKLAYAQDIPFLSSSTFAQYKVMESAKQNNIKVLLDGQGADELFGGYSRHKIAFTWEMVQKMEMMKAHFFFHSKANTMSLKTFFIDTLKLSEQGKIFKSKFKNPLSSVLKSDFLAINGSQKVDFNAFEGLNKTLNKEFTSSGYLKSLLRFEDRNSMAHGIESRTPFADDIDLIEHVFSLPSKVKMKAGWSKYLLRNVINNKLPNEITWRKDKMGFVTPNNQWIGNNHQYFTDLVTEYCGDILDTKKWQKQRSSFFKLNNKPETYKHWKLISVALWRKVFDV